MTRIVIEDDDILTLDAYSIRGDEIQTHDHFAYKIVATVFPNGEWCAYRGRPNHDTSYVADCGDAIPEAAAVALFPTLQRAGLTYHNP